MTRTYRVGMIGCGETAGWRARALRAAGFEITAVASRPGSPRVREFAAAHQIPRVYDNWRELLDAFGDTDALAVCTWPDGTPEVLAAALDLGAPILVEKPVAWSSACLKALCEKPHENVMVGYNRRIYPSALAAREEVRSGPPLVAQLNLPSSVAAPAEPDPAGNYMRSFFESVSALGLDMTRYIFGDLSLVSVRRMCNPAGNLNGFAAILTTRRGDVISTTGNWDAAANFSLTLSRPGRRFELLPFEIASVYEGMEVLAPTEEYPIRRYVPKLARRVMLEGIDLREKPAFFAECGFLKSMLDGTGRPEAAATLEDALAITSLCEELTGHKY